MTRIELRRNISHKRRGTAIIELAVCLPMMVIIAVGAIEATNAIFLKEHLTAAAYEGARSAIAPGQTAAGATTAATNVLKQFSIFGGSVTITPSVSAATTTGSSVSVTVTAPLGSNSCIAPFIIGKLISNMSATVTMEHQ